MKRLVSLLLFVIPIISSAADPSMRVTDLALEQCELKEVIVLLQYETIEKAGAIAEQSLQMRKELRRINAKAKVPDKPLIDQLGPEDIAKFAEISQRLKSTQLAQLMESRRERDLTVIQKIVVLADREYRWSDHPGEKDPDYIIYATLQLLRLTVKKSDITVPKTLTCSLELALHSVENEVIKNLNSLNVDAAMASLKSILAKYKMEKLDDRSRLSKSDLQKVNELLNTVFEPMERHYAFIEDMEHIKLMARASEIMYESNKQDIAFGGGDIDAIGKSLQRRNQNNEFDEDTLIAIRLWTKINEKIPSQVVQDSAEYLKLLEEIDAGKKSKKTK